MPRFAANLTLLYNEHPFLDRFEAAARDGFEAVECLFPYGFDPGELARRLAGNGLRQVLFNAPPGDWDAGERGLASLPGRQAEFRGGIARALDVASILGCTRIHVMAGLAAPGVRPADQQATYEANLAWAAEQAAGRGCDLLIEPINTRDMPGYWLNRQDEAHRVVQAVGAPNLKVQMDLYHCQVGEGDVETKIRQHLPTGRIGHFQVAGAPARHEPDLGEMNCQHLFNVIDEVAAACGWQGWIGCEYRPLRGAQPSGTSDGLGWLARARMTA